MSIFADKRIVAAYIDTDFIMNTPTTADSVSCRASATKSERLLSLDVMRGMTIVGMIIVNNAGGPESYEYLQHSYWNGLTPCDLVFPFFLFIMGVTTWLSMSRHAFNPTPSLITKILRRTMIILLIGWALHWFEGGMAGHGWLDFSRLRITGVLTRIAICYCTVSLLTVYAGFRTTLWIGGILFAGYAILLKTLHGYDYDLSNFNAIADRAILGETHLYTKKPVDPEGLASTVSAIAHTVIGLWCGHIIKSDKPLSQRIVTLYLAGFLMLAAGWTGSEWFPVNKRIWSPTYVLVTCGGAASLLATLMYVIDERKHTGWCTFFTVFGVNPLFLYVLSEGGACVIKHFGADTSVYEIILCGVPDPCLASAIYSVALMLLTGVIGYPLYRRHIYIKI